MKRDRVNSFDLSADERFDVARFGAVLAVVLAASIVAVVVQAARLAAS